MVICVAINNKTIKNQGVDGGVFARLYMLFTFDIVHHKLIFD